MSEWTLAHAPDIHPEWVHAQIEVFLSGLKKAEAISIACVRGLHSACPIVICPGNDTQKGPSGLLEGRAAAGAGPPSRRRDVPGRHDDDGHGTRGRAAQRG